MFGWPAGQAGDGSGQIREKGKEKRQGNRERIGRVIGRKKARESRKEGG